MNRNLYNKNKKKFILISLRENVSLRSKRGFTLVELMVSVTLFLIVMGISTGSLLSIIDSNKKAQSMRGALDNLSLAVEEMSRSIRQGRYYHCDVTVAPTDTFRDCEDGANSIAFEYLSGDTTDISDQVHYRLNVGADRLEKSIDNGFSYIQMTSPEIQINKLTFYVKGNESIYSIDDQNPRVTLVIDGTTGEGRHKTEFSFQTTISQRAIEE